MSSSSRVADARAIDIADRHQPSVDYAIGFDLGRREHEQDIVDQDARAAIERGIRAGVQTTTARATTNDNRQP